LFHHSIVQLPLAHNTSWKSRWDECTWSFREMRE